MAEGTVAVAKMNSYIQRLRPALCSGVLHTSRCPSDAQWPWNLGVGLKVPKTTDRGFLPPSHNDLLRHLYVLINFM